MRDDFTQQTLEVLAKRVGVRCSNPVCKKLTTGPRTDASKIVNIGVGAHITAASPAGPRYDASLTPSQRASPENGIWLCQNCAKLIDNDSSRYTRAILLGWKQTAEAAALRDVEGQTHVNDGVVEDETEIELSFKKSQSTSDRHDYVLEVRVKNRGVVPLAASHVDLDFPSRALENPSRHALFIPDRPNLHTSVFRWKAPGTEGTIFPGDAKRVISLNYFVDKALYIKRGDLFSQPVRATLYRPGLPPLAFERPFEDFQNF